MKQGTYLKAVKPFTMKIEGARGKPINVKIGDMFMITTAMNTDSAKIDRLNKAQIGVGYNLSFEIINQLFDVLE